MVNGRIAQGRHHQRQHPMRYRCEAFYWMPNCALGDQLAVTTRCFRFKWSARLSAWYQFGSFATRYEIVEVPA